MTAKPTARPRIMETDPAADCGWPAACGPALGVLARQLLGAKPAFARLAEELKALLAAGHRVALRVTDLGSGRQAERRLARLCERIGTVLGRAALDPGGLELTIEAASISPRAAFELRLLALGPGTLNVIVGDALLSGQAMRGRTAPDPRWIELWRLRNEAVINAVWPQVSSACQLLADEPAADVLPVTGLQAPAQSAFLYAPLDVSGCATDSRVLEPRITAIIDAADAMHDELTWPTPAMQQDAWLNRRVAIVVEGIGTLCVRRRLDPRSHATLAELDALLSCIRGIATQHSRRLARSCESLPVIAATDPGSHFNCATMRDEWSKRWRRAVDVYATRHRNLIAMSPWSLFPNDDTNDGWVNLLPLLAHADACIFRRPRTVLPWNVAEFIRFHRRLAAVRSSRQRPNVIAERP